MIKISCALAKHFKVLKNGAIRRQKTPVSDPLWRFTVVVGDVMFGRLFQEKPSLEQLSGCMDHVLDQSREVMGDQALMAMSLDKAIPGFAQRLQEKGLEVFVPRGSSGGLATVAKRWDKFLDTLDFCMTTLSEGDLTVDESTALAGNEVGVIGPIAHEKDVKVAHDLARQVCALRGRDPGEGARRWQSTGFKTKPHTSTSTAAEHDGLASLIQEYSPSNVPSGYMLTEDARRIYDIARSIEGVRRHPAGSDEAQAARVHLASVLQQSILGEITAEPRTIYPHEFSREMSPISVVLSRWLGLGSPEMRLFEAGLSDACRLPFVIGGATYVFFRLPVEWHFENGIERIRKVRYLPWREVAEQHLMQALPTGCRVVLNDSFGVPNIGGASEFPLCCFLLNSMRHGRRYDEEKGKRASAAVPKGHGEAHKTTDVIGVMRHPVVGASAPQWKPNLDQELTDAVETINANLANSWSGLTFAFGRPLLM